MTLEKADISKAAVCGLFCASCTLYIGIHHDPKRQEALAKSLNLSLDELRCNGCRSEVKTAYCRSCQFVKCAAEKGIQFCGECGDYPCAELEKFQAARPHRIELWADQKRIREVGFEQWYQEKLEHYSCPECGTVNSAYDSKCYQCGATPSCRYVKEHQEEMAKFR